jgi:hypothetical protein
MVKNILVCFIALGFLLGISGFALAFDQTVSGDVALLGSATLVTTTVNYGSINPGAESPAQINTIHVDADNNANLNVAISFFSGNDLFKNLYFDVNKGGTYEDPAEKLDIVTLNWVIPDQVGAFDNSINSVLRVPTGSPAIAGASATILYTITTIVA